MKTKPVDLIGKTFGQLEVLELAGMENGKSVLLCKCSCGNTTKANVGHLTGGGRISCGCATKGKPTHGMRRTRTYSIWCDVLKRCNNEKSISYRWYGAKGVKVCDRWRSFENFFADMGEAPEGLTIDRIDSSKDYRPGNCRWATPQEQTENRECQKFYELNGVSKTLPKWCEELGIKYRTMRSRMYRSGMSFIEAVNYKGLK